MSFSARVNLETEESPIGIYILFFTHFELNWHLSQKFILVMIFISTPKDLSSSVLITFWKDALHCGDLQTLINRCSSILQMYYQLCCSDPAKCSCTPYLILRKCIIFGGSNTHPTTFLEDQSSIDFQSLNQLSFQENRRCGRGKEMKKLWKRIRHQWYCYYVLS